MTESLTMYSTPWCGHCVRLKRQLDSEGIGYVDIDIETDPDAAEAVRAANGGHETVPTVIFPDGSVATNPSLREVQERLSA